MLLCPFSSPFLLCQHHWLGRWVSQCKGLDKNKFSFSPLGLLAHHAAAQTVASAPPGSMAGDHGSHLELLELVLQLKETIMQSRHSSLVPHFLDSEVGVTGLLSLQECFKDKCIKATALKLRSCPLGKAQHLSGWDGEGSGKLHLASPTSLHPHRVTECFGLEGTIQIIQF